MTTTGLTECPRMTRDLWPCRRVSAGYGKVSKSRAASATSSHEEGVERFNRPKGRAISGRRIINVQRLFGCDLAGVRDQADRAAEGRIRARLIRLRYTETKHGLPRLGRGLPTPFADVPNGFIARLIASHPAPMKGRPRPGCLSHLVQGRLWARLAAARSVVIAVDQ